jgi:hypothetical protein
MNKNFTTMIISENTQEKIDKLIDEKNPQRNNVKYVNTKKDGLFEKTIINCQKQLITEDNKLVLFD